MTLLRALKLLNVYQETKQYYLENIVSYVVY